jgi:hypothetical protein
MHAVLITLTPGCRHTSIDCQKAKVRIDVHSIMAVKTQLISTLEFFERAYRLWEFTPKWLQNSAYSHLQTLFTTQDEWTIVKYVMNVLRPWWHWTLWISKRHTVTLHHINTVYNEMFDHMDGVMWALSQKMTQGKKDLFFAVKLAWQKLSKYYTQVTATMGTLLIAVHIPDFFWNVWSFIQ